MDMKEIDPKLFVTCRLCLEDTGGFQILPTVQKQIKFCFDIDVDLYDGLPQLLCKKCKTLLTDYNTTKEIFLAKQESLKQRIGEQNEKSSSKSPDVHTGTKPFNRKRVISSSTDSESDSDSKKVREGTQPLSSPIQQIHSTSTEENNASWEAAYSKVYVCKMCNHMFRRKNAWESHFYSHDTLQKKYPSVFAKKCTVYLNRIDDKPNLPGDMSMVVLSCEKVIKQCHPDYYLMYTINHSSSPLQCKNHSTINSSSATFNGNCNMQKRRERRLISRSSVETMVMEDTRSSVSDEFKIKSGDSNKLMQNGLTDCINIDDSSDSGCSTSQDRSTINRNAPKEADGETIKNIISMCLNKIVPNASNSEQNKFRDQIKHKVLSVGKKILHKRCFNSTGILRYMEWNDLKVIWIPKANKQPSYIHTKIETDKSSNKGDWTKIDSDVAQKAPKGQNQAVVQQEPSIPTLETTSDYEITSVQDTSLDSAILYSDTTICDARSKLLNENPVANPKQLPKKLRQNPQGSSSDVQLSPDQVNHICMPVITSTTSLAEISVLETDNAIAYTSSGEQPPQAPRIKVKPVSELLSKSTLQTLKLQESNSNMNPQATASSYPEVQVPFCNVSLTNGNTSGGMLDMSHSETVANNGYVILDSVEIPNMKTNSPFNYFRSLLIIHNIQLLDNEHVLSREFVCLIKFRVYFNQEARQPIVICLSLYNLKNSFCMKIKDNQQVNIKIDNIAPNWQWELLKLYRGDLVNKLLQNAKEVSQETFNYVQTFLCLLKSINLKAES